MGPAAVPAGAAAATAISVTLPGGVTRSIPSTALPNDGGGEGEICVLRGHPGEEPPPTTHGGLPVAEVFEAAGVSPSFGYLSIPRQNGTVAYLPHEYFYGESPFEGCKFATFSYDGNTKFFRPPLAGDPNDVNAEDFIATVSGEALTVGVHEGHVLEVQVSPSTTSTTAGTPVQFTATVVGGGEFDLAWTFGDGTTATGASVGHAFSGVGTYLVRVTATGTGGDGSGGESGPAEVVVGDPPTTEAPGATTTPRPPTTATPTGAPGKGREGRGGKGSKPAPGGGDKVRKPKQSKDDSSPQRAASPASRSATHATEAPSTPTSSPPSELPGSPPPTPEEPSGEGPAEPPRCCSAGPSPDGSLRPSPSPSQAQQSTPEGELVEGRLVGDDLGPATIGQAVGAGAEGEGSRSAPGAVGKGGVGVPAIALAVVALLAGGAFFEWRRSRPIR